MRTDELSILDVALISLLCCFQKTIQYPRFAHPPEAIATGGRRPVTSRNISPGRSGPQPPESPVQHTTGRRPSQHRGCPSATAVGNSLLWVRDPVEGCRHILAREPTAERLGLAPVL
jgi:hypothetical protein